MEKKDIFIVEFHTSGRGYINIPQKIKRLKKTSGKN